MAALLLIAFVVAQDQQVKDAIQKSIDVLLECQEGDPKAQWPYEGGYRVNNDIPIGYRIGGTAFCALALLEAPGGDEQRRQAIDREAAFVVEALKDKRMGPDLEAGYEVPDAVLQRAIKSIETARLDSGAFQYQMASQKSGKGFEAVEGSTARSPLGEAVLLLAGKGSADRIRAALHAFFEHWEWLDKRRQQKGTHEPPYMIAPYYFFFGHRYAALAIELLPEKDRPEYRKNCTRRFSRFAKRTVAGTTGRPARFSRFCRRRCRGRRGRPSRLQSNTGFD